ncbi:rRNA biogenesis protein rrp5 [Smittium mucronatum]|uniref:rRNA biogenesis protein rrp5 n=1 Tax=Smittium mucronatum TaxID=133383 RepID=A0A1R0GLU3_9FUNG|nr:rRNA biogenesis protein rrp5 [Smittium mucronatum]
MKTPSKKSTKDGDVPSVVKNTMKSGNAFQNKPKNKDILKAIHKDSEVKSSLKTTSLNSSLIEIPDSKKHSNSLISNKEKAVVEEEDFPRGGSTGLSHLEYKEITRQADLDLLKEESNLKKSKRKTLQSPNSTKKVKIDSETNDFDDQVSKTYSSISPLNFKRIIKGDKILGVVSRIDELGLKISLPDNLSGYVPITQISKELTALVENVVQDDSQIEEDQKVNDSVLDLSTRFYPGQFLKVSVTSVSEKPKKMNKHSALNTKSTLDMSKADKMIELSLEPELTNKGLSISDISSGMIMSASVSSLEDHGYVLNTGIDEIKGFLSYKQSNQYAKDHFSNRIADDIENNDDAQLNVGQVILVSVSADNKGLGTSDANRTRVVNFTVDEKAVSKSQILDTIGNIHSIQPGSLITAMITKIGEKGASMQFMGFYDCVAPVGNIFTDRSIDPSTGISNYKLGEKLKVRIIYVSLSTESKQIMVSLASNIMNFEISKPLSNQEDKSSIVLGNRFDNWWPLRYGFVSNATVVRAEEKRGVYLNISLDSGESFTSFTSSNYLSDSPSSALSSNIVGNFKIGSTVKARVIGFSPMDNVLITTLKKSVVDEPLFQLSDLEEALKVKSTIENITPAGIFVRISPFLTGLVTMDQLSDIKITNVEKRFSIGEVVKSRILSIDRYKKRFLVTFRRSLVESSLPPLTSFDRSLIGQSTNGIVLNVKEKGAVIGFYQKLTGYLPIKEISSKFVTDINEFLRIGMPIKVRITNVDPEYKKIYCSYILNPVETNKSESEHANNESATIGKIYESSIVDFINESDIGLILNPDGIKATLNINHLSDHMGNVVERIKSMLTTGKPLGIPVVVIEKKSTGIFVSAKPLLVYSSKNNSIIKSYDDCKIGTVATGFVSHTKNFGVFVKFFNGFSALANINSISDYYISSIESEFLPNQTVLAKIVSLDSEKKTANLSLKPSLLESATEDSQNKSLIDKANHLFVSQLFETERQLLKIKNDESLVKLYESYGSILCNYLDIKIEQVLSYGWTVKLGDEDKIVSLKDPSGFVHLDHIVNSENDHNDEIEKKPGSILKARVLDTDYFKKVIDFSIKPNLLGSGKLKEKKKKEIYKRLSDLSKAHNETEVIVELVKEDHLVLSVPSCSNYLTYACSKSLNYRDKPFNRFKVGQRLRGQIVIDGEEPRVLCIINPKKESGSLSSVNRIVNNPIDPSIRYFEDYQPGKITKAKVISISKNKMHAKMMLADSIMSRLNSTELIDTYDGNLNIFEGKNISPGSVLQVAVLGVYMNKNSEYLPITRRISPSKTILDLSVEQNLKNEQRNWKVDDIKLGMIVKCIVSKVDSERSGGIWVQINNNLKARITIPSITSDYFCLTNLHSIFPTGSPIEVKITNCDSKKVFIDAVISENEYKKRSIPPPVKSIKDIKVGSIIAGYMTKFDPVMGINVLVNCYNEGVVSSVHGRVSLVDISDDYNSIEKFIKSVTGSSNLINVKISSIDSKNDRVDMSSRASQLGSVISTVTDPLIDSIDQIKVGEKINGFITSVNKNGAFVLIGSNRLTGRVKLSEMSKDFIKSPESVFKPGTVVKTIVLSADRKSKKIDLSMIVSKNVNKIRVGDIVKGNVTKISDKGLFIMIYDNYKRKKVACLCPIGEIADTKDQSSKDLLSHYDIGDKVIAKVVKVDEKYKITLSLKSSHFISSELQEPNPENQDIPVEFEEVDKSVDGSDTENNQMDIDEDIESGSDMESDNDSDNDNESEDEEVKDKSNGYVSSETLLGQKPLDISEDFSWTNETSGNDDDNDDSHEEESEEESKKSDALKLKKKNKVINDITGDILDKQPTTVEEFERLLVSSPNSSFIWVSYMAFYCDLGEIDMARKVCERGLDKISFRMENEKMNLYVASLNLEYKFGNSESLKKAFDKALVYMNQKHIYLQLANIYSSNGDSELALETYQTMCKKFKTSAKVWIKYFEFCLKTQKDSNAIMKRSLECLPKRKHIKVISKYAGLSFKYNQQEVGRTIFENLISNYPSRTDLWNVYLDLEVKNISNLKVTSESDLFSVRNLFTRVTSLRFNPKNMKLFFKKWLGFENKYGTENNVEDVKRRAMEYVQSL